MNGFLRGRGTAVIITDLHLKSELVKAIPFFNGYWNSVIDPSYILVKFDLSSIFIYDPSESGDKIIAEFDNRTGKMTLNRISREKYLNE